MSLGALYRSNAKEIVSSTGGINSIVLFVGTGISRLLTQCSGATSGHPHVSWQGLLKHGHELCDRRRYFRDNVSNPKAREADIVKLQIENGSTRQLVLAGEVITEVLGGVHDFRYKEWLKSAFQDVRVQNMKLRHALDSFRRIITTNYDHLLSDGGASREAITLNDYDAVKNFVGGGPAGNYVLHLHGDYTKPQSVVLGLRSYMKALGNNPMQNLMRAVVTTGRLVFVGCGEAGFGDDNLRGLRAWMREVLGHDHNAEHFILCPSKELKAMDEGFAGESWFRVIPFGDDYEDLCPFLDAMIEATLERPSLVGDPGDESSRQAESDSLFRGGSQQGITDTGKWSEYKVREALERIKQEHLQWDETPGSARRWWEAFEKENAHRLRLVYRLAEELRNRRANITELFLAHLYSNTDNIQANLHYLDYSKLKREWEQRMRAERDDVARAQQHSADAPSSGQNVSSASKEVSPNSPSARHPESHRRVVRKALGFKVTERTRKGIIGRKEKVKEARPRRR